MLQLPCTERNKELSVLTRVPKCMVPVTLSQRWKKRQSVTKTESLVASDHQLPRKDHMIVTTLEAIRAYESQGLLSCYQRTNKKCINTPVGDISHVNSS